MKLGVYAQHYRADYTAIGGSLLFQYRTPTHYKYRQGRGFPGNKGHFMTMKLKLQ